MLDDALGLFQQSAAQWKKAIEDAAMFIFWTLGTISLVYTYGMLLLRKADIGEFFAETVRFMLFFGFFFWLLQNGPAFANDIVNSLRTLGDTASGSYGGTSPSRVIDVGLKVLAKTADAGRWWEPDIWLGAWIVALISLILLVLVGLNLFMLYAASYIVLYAGFFVLGFGGSRWTSDMAINYYKSVLAIALKLMTMILLIGLCGNLVEKYFNAMPERIDLVKHCSFLIFCLTFFVISHSVPDMVAGMVGGGAAGVGSSSGGAMFSAAKTAMTAAAAAGGAAVGAAAAAGGAAVGVAAAATGLAEGVASALKASAGISGDGADSSMFDTGSVKQPPPPAKAAQAAASGGGGGAGSSNGSSASGSTGGAQGTSGSSGAQGAQGSSSGGGTSGGDGQQGASDASDSSASNTGASDSTSASSGSEAASDDASSQNTDLAQQDHSSGASDSGVGQQGAADSSDSSTSDSSSTDGQGGRLKELTQEGGVKGALATMGAMAVSGLEAAGEGTKNAVKGAASSAHNKWRQRVDNSVGGKFREAVRATKGLPSGNTQPIGSHGDTYSKASANLSAAERKAEVDAFVNKHNKSSST